MKSENTKLSTQLKKRFGSDATILTSANGQVTLQVDHLAWLESAQILRDSDEFAFNQLTDLCAVDFLGYGQQEWETQDATRDGFSRGVEGLGPGRFDWKNRPEAKDVDQDKYLPMIFEPFVLTIHYLYLFCIYTLSSKQ